MALASSLWGTHAARAAFIERGGRGHRSVRRVSLAERGERARADWLDPEQWANVLKAAAPRRAARAAQPPTRFLLSQSVSQAAPSQASPHGAGAVGEGRAGSSGPRARAPAAGVFFFFFGC